MWCYVATRIERRESRVATAVGALQYPWCYSKTVLSTIIIVAAGAAREAGRRP